MPTVIVGLLGGLVVGVTSVGSGSLVIIELMASYPMLTASRLVGADLVQAVPLVVSAAAGHLLFGEFNLALTVSLLLGCGPGAWVGARISSRAPGGLIRRVLAIVLLALSLKMLGVPDEATALILLTAVLAGPHACFALQATVRLSGARVDRSSPPARAGCDPPQSSRTVTTTIVNNNITPNRNPPTTSVTQCSRL